MIISHKYKFIFIKTRKTAGTSIEVDLNRVLAIDDIATPIFPPIQGHSPRNFLTNEPQSPLYNHMSAQEVADYIGMQMFKRYFVFCVEREPIDKTLSHYSFIKNSPNHKSNIKTFDQYMSANMFPVDTALYTDTKSNLLVDKILKYENLAEELHETCKFLGFDFHLSSKAKSGFREQLELTKDQKCIIEEAFRPSLRHTGYNF